MSLRTTDVSELVMLVASGRGLAYMKHQESEPMIIDGRPVSASVPSGLRGRHDANSPSSAVPRLMPVLWP
jgi:hypothetical protein